MNPYETRRQEQQERDKVYRDEYGYNQADVPFAQLVGHNRVCQICFAVMVDPGKHTDWHDSLTGT